MKRRPLLPFSNERNSLEDTGSIDNFTERQVFSQKMRLGRLAFYHFVTVDSKIPSQQFFLNNELVNRKSRTEVLSNLC
jgi:hypothetical protein